MVDRFEVIDRYVGPDFMAIMRHREAKLIRIIMDDILDMAIRGAPHHEIAAKAREATELDLVPIKGGNGFIGYKLVRKI